MAGTGSTRKQPISSVQIWVLPLGLALHLHGCPVRRHELAEQAISDDFQLQGRNAPTPR